LAAQNGHGAGTLVLAQAPELLALLGALAASHPFAFADRDGKAVSVREVLELGARFVPTPSRRSSRSAVTLRCRSTLKSVGRPQVPF